MQPKQFEADIERVFVNARKFNAKHTDIHKQACAIYEKMLHLFGNARFKEVTVHNSKVTYDEFIYGQYMYRYHKALRKGVPTDDKKPTEFKLSPKDLLQTPE